MKIILGASGAGSPRSPAHPRVAEARRGPHLVNGTRVDELSESDLMPVRADLGMVFQESALFDSLTVRENVGYRLYEETRQPIEEVDRRVEKSGLRRAR
jgi:phospholipid/cholesterol/gamma-HCH transport system ATP-binding protein